MRLLRLDELMASYTSAGLLTFTACLWRRSDRRGYVAVPCIDCAKAVLAISTMGTSVTLR